MWGLGMMEEIFFEIRSIFEIYNTNDDDIINYFEGCVQWFNTMQHPVTILYPNNVSDDTEYNIQELAIQHLEVLYDSYNPLELKSYLENTSLIQQEIVFITDNKTLSCNMLSDGIYAIYLNSQNNTYNNMVYSLLQLMHHVYIQYLPQLVCIPVISENNTYYFNTATKVFTHSPYKYSETSPMPSDNADTQITPMQGELEEHFVLIDA